MVTYEEIKKDPQIDTYFQMGNKFLGVMGAIQHNYRHAELVAENSRTILQQLGHPPEECELAAVAGYLHDLGNLLNRYDHGRTGAVLAYSFLKRLKFTPEEKAIVMGAIGNHEERNGTPVNYVGAAVIIADKADAHRSRVRKTDFATFTQRDRVNYAVEDSSLSVNAGKKIISIAMRIDLQISSVMEYFEIFLPRMTMCRRAAAHLNCSFELFINDARFL